MNTSKNSLNNNLDLTDYKSHAFNSLGRARRLAAHTHENEIIKITKHKRKLMDDA